MKSRYEDTSPLLYGSVTARAQSPRAAQRPQCQRGLPGTISEQKVSHALAKRDNFDVSDSVHVLMWI